MACFDGSDLAINIFNVYSFYCKSLLDYSYQAHHDLFTVIRMQYFYCWTKPRNGLVRYLLGLMPEWSITGQRVNIYSLEQFDQGANTQDHHHHSTRVVFDNFTDHQRMISNCHHLKRPCNKLGIGNFNLLVPEKGQVYLIMNRLSWFPLNLFLW